MLEISKEDRTFLEKELAHIKGFSISNCKLGTLANLPKLPNLERVSAHASPRSSS